MVALFKMRKKVGTTPDITIPVQTVSQADLNTAE